MKSSFVSLGACALSLFIVGTVKAEQAPGADPVATVQQAFDAVTVNQPERIWDLMPPSYQQEAEELVIAFATTADAESWNHLRRLLGRFSRALVKQENLVFDYFASEEALTDAETAKARDSIRSISSLSGHLANSPITDLERLKQGRLRELLAGEGHALMEIMSKVVNATPDDDDNAWRRTRDAKVELLDAEGDRATVRVTMADEVEEIELVHVESRWIPAEMAAGWQKTTRDLRQQIDNLDPETPEGQKNKMGMIMMLGVVDGVLTQFERVNTAEDLEAILNNLLMLKQFGGQSGW